MRDHVRQGAFLLFAGALVMIPGLCQAQALQISCTELADLHLPDVRVTEAVAVVSGEEAPGGIADPHCKVSGVIGREIGFEALLPDEWNGRFAMGGGSGFVGSIQNSAAWTVNQGYATVGTDTGHQDAWGADWALDHAERQVNFGHQAVHRTAEVAKAILRAYYGSAPEYSYFLGCSRGGGQGLMEAQRYPEDFDGIVSGAPAFDWTGWGAEMVQNMQASYPDASDISSPGVTSANRQVLESRILEACDALDGVEDGVMEDPRDCTFELATLPACADDQPESDCLTDLQRAAIEEIYAPATTADGSMIYPGQPFGGEGQVWGWQNIITGPTDFGPEPLASGQWYFGTEIFKYFVFSDPNWDYTTYDFSNWEQDTRFASALLDATDPDLSAFASRHGKLLLWHGWSDPGLTALGSVRYYEQVEALDPDVREYFRMYMLPGVQHCSGGPGPDQVDWLSVLVDWVESDTAPERVIATKSDTEGAVVRTRPLCPYPQRAMYSGNGSTDEAETFVCTLP